MEATIALSVLLLGLFNSVSAIYFLGQNLITALIGVGVSLAIVAIMYVFKITPSGSVWSIATLVVVANIAILGVVLSTHALKDLNSTLYTPSNEFVKQQAEYKKLLD